MCPEIVTGYQLGFPSGPKGSASAHIVVGDAVGDAGPQVRRMVATCLPTTVANFGPNPVVNRDYLPYFTSLFRAEESLSFQAWGVLVGPGSMHWMQNLATQVRRSCDRVPTLAAEPLELRSLTVTWGAMPGQMHPKNNRGIHQEGQGPADSAILFLQQDHVLEAHTRLQDRKYILTS